MFGHVKWFTDSMSNIDYGGLTMVEFSFVVAIVFAGLGLLYLIANLKHYKHLDKSLDKRFKKIGPYAALITRLSLGAALLINAWNEYFWAQNVSLDGEFQQFIIWFSAGIGLLLILGVFVRASALYLTLLFVLSFFFGDGVHLLEQFVFLGMAGYLVAAGGGPYTFKSVKPYDLEVFESLRPQALKLFRYGVGISLITLALSEKLLGFDIAHEFLSNHDWNFLDSLGVSDRFFIIIAGSIELMIGLALILNLATRLVLLLLLGLFITTAALLGMDEVVGHLFAVGLLAAVWFNYPRSK